MKELEQPSYRCQAVIFFMMLNESIKGTRSIRIFVLLIILGCYNLFTNYKIVLNFEVSRRDLDAANKKDDVGEQKQAQLRIKINQSLKNETEHLPSPPNTLGAFIHVGKTAGSTISKLLRNGCHSFVPKPCFDEKYFNASHESAISKLTTYYHKPDFEKEKLREFQHEFFVITLRDPLLRAISAFKCHHPYRIASGKLESYKTDNELLHDFYLRKWPDKVERIQRIININRFNSTIVYKCFHTLEEYAQLLANFSDYKEGTWEAYVENKDCASVAKTTLSHISDEPMEHFYWDLREILFQIHDGLRDKVMLVLRQEFLWQDWVSANHWLGDEEGEVFTPTNLALRNSSDLDVPINTTLSDEGRRHLCLALEEEYRIYLRVLVLSMNLSEKELADSLSIARKSCPGLDLQLPDRDTPTKIVASRERGTWDL